MKVNVTEALKWYKKAANLGSAEGMASYSMLVSENFLIEKYDQAYKYLAQCSKRNDDLCKFSTAMFALYDSAKATQKAVKNRKIDQKSPKFTFLEKSKISLFSQIYDRF